MAKPRPSETSASYTDHLKFNTAQRPDVTGTDETPSIPLHDLLQRNPFGEKLITITARNLNQTQITNFLQRMHEYETPDYRVSSRKDDEEEDQTPTKTSKRPWDPDNSENTIDAGDYETSQSNTKTEKKTQESTEKSSKKKKSRAEEEQEASKKHRRFKRSRRSRQTEEEDEIISAYNVLMQRTGFALPIFLVVPATVVFLTDACASRDVDPCFMSSLLSMREIFWECEARRGHFWSWNFWLQPQTWIWIGWLLSQGWDIDLDNEETSETYETIGMSGIASKPPPSICSIASSRLDSGLIRDSASAADEITKIYACATLWHESALEMTCLLKSIFRMDEDQCARRNAQKYLKVIDPDYYEFEAHILVDDAFDTSDYGEPLINKYVRTFIEKVDDAARYLYYILGFQLMSKVLDQQRKETITESTFILTLDGDVDFTPKCVHLLVDLMKKNRRLGAACGRIHPRGSGPMIWYQKFEYAAEIPAHYVQYDQGEDRWLCTLLLQRGYRVEYCAASDALTFAPEGFSEFFNQRRRWISSTISNIIDLLRDYKNVVAVNESISIWYIFYQLVMLISSILGPIIFAEVISAIFAMLMTAVIVGTMLQIQKDGITSPHSIFLITVTTSFTVSAVLHPLEFTCILPALLYFLAIPCMYMLLPIYSICNLNSVSWGTRESPTLRQDEHKDKAIRLDLIEGGLGSQADGEISFGCGNACRFMCCLRPDPVETSPQIWRLNEGIKDISRKLDQLERRHAHDENRRNSSRTDADAETWPDGEEEEPDDDMDMKRQSQAAMRNRKWKNLRSEAWLNDKQLKRAERDHLDGDEEQFWVEVIDEYLQPIAMDTKAQEEIRVGLTELRNKTCAVFFMINIVFIIVVLVLQMQKDCLHIEWPFGPKFNHTVVPCNSDKKEHIWVMSRLQLEPIGLLFLVFYMSILVIQFVAMLLHRFSTLEHIIASTELFFSKSNTDKGIKPELVVQNAVEIARELQAIRGIDELEDDVIKEKAISRRKVVRALESSRKSMSKKRTETLDAAFKRRFDNIAAMNEDGEGDFGTLGLQLRDKRLTLQKGSRQNFAFGGTIDRRVHP
ncbi:Chitin synthase [Aphelenchoides besseyi]|nr:Chitin synthase [Aphelenchoides besseyi]